MKNKKILLGLFLLLFCFLLVGCDYLEQQKFIKKNINKFERKCKSQYGDNVVLYDVKARMAGNGDNIGIKKISSFLFGRIKDSNNNTKDVRYNTQTDILYSNEKDRLTKNATEKMELSGVKSIYKTVLYMKDKDCGIPYYLGDANNIEFEKSSQTKGLDCFRDKHGEINMTDPEYDTYYDIIAIFFTDKFDQHLLDNTVIKELFKNNTNNYSIWVAIVEYDDKNHTLETVSDEDIVDKWFEFIHKLKREEVTIPMKRPIKPYWDQQVESENPSVLNKMVVYYNSNNDNKTEYKVKEYK